jgi:hypothetical protein
MSTNQFVPGACSKKAREKLTRTTWKDIEYTKDMISTYLDTRTQTDHHPGLFLELNTQSPSLKHPQVFVATA